MERSSVFKDKVTEKIVGIVHGADPYMDKDIRRLMYSEKVFQEDYVDGKLYVTMWITWGKMHREYAKRD